MQQLLRNVNYFGAEWITAHKRGYGLQYLFSCQLPWFMARCAGMTIRMDKSGRIVLPKMIRERFGLTPDLELEVIEQSVKSRRFPKKYVETIQQTWEGATARTAWELYNAFTAVITHSISPKSYERGRLLSYQVDRIFRELT